MRNECQVALSYIYLCINVIMKYTYDSDFYTPIHIICMYILYIDPISGDNKATPASTSQGDKKGNYICSLIIFIVTNF